VRVDSGTISSAIVRLKRAFVVSCDP
jgi:hypothetical protein